MRSRGGWLVLMMLGCGTPPEPSEARVASPEPEETWTQVIPGRLEVWVRDRLATHGVETAAVFRVTNHGDTAVLADLRSLDRVVRPDARVALRSPLTPEQTAELSLISALVQVPVDGFVTYAVPTEPCTDARDTALAGRLVALDGARTIELVADGAHATLACDPRPLPPGTSWVATAAPMLAPDRAPEATAGLPDLLRAASVDATADVALLPFSYDARPIERWRYDTCVAAGTCPARAVPQPPGSISAPAVGMRAAGADAFCEARSLRALTREETAAVGDPARALVVADPADVVASGFRCGRSEPTP